MDILSFNRSAWDQQVEYGNPWTIPVTSEQVAAARQGHWAICLTSTKPAPASWFPPLTGRDVLCLASGGGQQGPILAAAGAHVTVLDNSPRQLEQDRLVAQRDGLEITTLLGNMADLSALTDQSFDLIVHPVANCFIPDVRPVWREAFRVLRPGGTLLSGFNNPCRYLFDVPLSQQGIFQVRFSLPYSDVTSGDPVEHVRLFGDDSPLQFSHMLETLIGGQMEAGFALLGLYEDRDRDEELSRYMPVYIATRAIKPS